MMNSMIFSVCISFLLFKFISPQEESLDAGLNNFAKSLATQFTASIPELGTLKLPDYQKTSFSKSLNDGYFSLLDGTVTNVFPLEMPSVSSKDCSDKTCRTISMKYKSPVITMGYRFSTFINPLGSLSGKFTTVMHDVTLDVAFRVYKTVNDKKEAVCAITKPTVDVSVDPDKYFVQFFYEEEGDGSSNDPFCKKAEKILTTFIEYTLLDTMKDVLQKKMLQVVLHALKRENEALERKEDTLFCLNL